VVVHFSGNKRRTGEVARPSPSEENPTQKSEGAEQTNGRAPTAPQPVRRTVFRVGFRAVFRPRMRAGRSETLAWRRNGRWAEGIGSFEDLEREVNRSRRFGHAFFLARIPRPHAGVEVDGWRERTMALLVSLVRSVDTVWSDGKDVFLLLPESDRAMGSAALARIREPLAEVLRDEDLERISFVVFAPDECLTSHALVSELRARAKDAKARTPGALGSPASRVADPEGAGG
jgi:hypothetical protein